MRYMNRPLSEWIRYGYNPIHIIGPYYLLRKYPMNIKVRKFTTYSIRKIRNDVAGVDK